MADHRPLGLRGRPRGVDDGGQVLAFDRPPVVGPDAALRLGRLATRQLFEVQRSGGDLAGRVERDDVAEGRALVADGLDLRRQLRVLHEQDHRTDVVDDVRGLAGFGLGVDGQETAPGAQLATSATSHSGRVRDMMQIASPSLMPRPWRPTEARSPNPELGVGPAHPPAVLRQLQRSASFGMRWTDRWISSTTFRAFSASGMSSASTSFHIRRPPVVGLGLAGEAAVGQVPRRSSVSPLDRWLG